MPGSGTNKFEFSKFLLQTEGLISVFENGTLSQACSRLCGRVCDGARCARRALQMLSFAAIRNCCRTQTARKRNLAGRNTTFSLQICMFSSLVTRSKSLNKAFFSLLFPYRLSRSWTSIQPLLAWLCSGFWQSALLPHSETDFLLLSCSRTWEQQSTKQVCVSFLLAPEFFSYCAFKFIIRNCVLLFVKNALCLVWFQCLAKTLLWPARSCLWSELPSGKHIRRVCAKSVLCGQELSEERRK